MMWLFTWGIVFGTGSGMGSGMGSVADDADVRWTRPDVVRWRLTHTAAPTGVYALPDRALDFRATSEWTCEVSEPTRETWTRAGSRYQRESRSITCASGPAWTRGVSQCLFETCADGTKRARTVIDASFTLGTNADDSIYLDLGCAIRSPAFGGVYVTAASQQRCKTVTVSHVDG